MFFRYLHLEPVTKLHSRDMKTQHIKFEILNERLSLFFCNIIQLNFVLNMFLIGQVCKETFALFGGVKDDVTRSFRVFAIGKLVNKLYPNFCHLV